MMFKVSRILERRPFQLDSSGKVDGKTGEREREREKLIGTNTIDDVCN